MLVFSLVLAAFAALSIGGGLGTALVGDLL
jgi:hypothetical protein